MKTKKQLSLIILITCLMITGIVYGEDPLTETKIRPVSYGLGWQEQTRRVTVFITDGLRITTGPSANTSGIGWSIGISSNFTFIECCRVTTLKQSWCNYNADDSRCRD
jgi:hypothetical protein